MCDSQSEPNRLFQIYKAKQKTGGKLKFIIAEFCCSFLIIIIKYFQVNLSIIIEKPITQREIQTETNLSSETKIYGLSLSCILLADFYFNDKAIPRSSLNKAKICLGAPSR